MAALRSLRRLSSAVPIAAIGFAVASGEQQLASCKVAVPTGLTSEHPPTVLHR